MKWLRWAMAVFAFAFLIILLVVFKTSGDLSSKFEPVVKALTQQYTHEGLRWKFILVTDVPYEVFGHCNLPALDNDHVMDMGQGGLVWFSGMEPGDSCYLVVKTKIGYNVEWFKRYSVRWHPYRTCRTGNVLPPSEVKTPDREW